MIRQRASLREKIATGFPVAELQKQDAGLPRGDDSTQLSMLRTRVRELQARKAHLEVLVLKSSGGILPSGIRERQIDTLEHEIRSYERKIRTIEQTRDARHEASGT